MPVESFLVSFLEFEFSTETEHFARAIVHV